MTAEAPAALPMSATRGTNYRSKRQFGTYPRGTVFPRWRLAYAGDVDEMVKSGMVEPTTDPVVVRFDVPETKTVPTEPVPDAAVQKELNTATEVRQALETENAGLRARVAELEKALMGRLIEWGKATDLHAIEREADAAAVRASQDAVAAVRKELATAWDRVADLEGKLATVAAAEPVPAPPEKTDRAPRRPKADPKADPKSPVPTAPEG